MFNYSTPEDIRHTTNRWFAIAISSIIFLLFSLIGYIKLDSERESKLCVATVVDRIVSSRNIDNSSYTYPQYSLKLKCDDSEPFEIITAVSERLSIGETTRFKYTYNPNYHLANKAKIALFITMVILIFAVIMTVYSASQLREGD